MKRYLLYLLILLAISCGGAKKKNTQEKPAIAQNVTEAEAVEVEESYVNEHDPNFLVKQLAKNLFVLNHNDTIFFEPPYLKYFTGTVDGKDAQVWLTYYLPCMEGLGTHYTPNAQLYVDGDSKVYHFVLDETYSAISYEDEPLPYELDYHNGTSELAVKTNNISYVLSQNEIQFRTTDGLDYSNVYCYMNDMVRSHWSYEFDFEAVGKNADFFSRARAAAGLSERPMLSHNIMEEVKKDAEYEEDNGYCYHMYSYTVTQPFYLDAYIYIILHYEDVYMGGAHGIYATEYYNIDRKTGKLLALEDILNIEDEDFKEYYTNKLTEEFELDYGGEIEMPSGFYVLPTGIWLRYPPYSLKGGFWEKEMFLPIEEIEDFLNWY